MGNKFARYAGVIFEQYVQQPIQLAHVQLCNFIDNLTFTCSTQGGVKMHKLGCHFYSKIVPDDNRGLKLTRNK